MAYQCYSDDEDLTSAIERELGAEPTVVIAGFTGSASAGSVSAAVTKDGRVLVTCTAGHQNAFDIQYRLQPGHGPTLVNPGRQVVGVVPTSNDQLLQSAAKALSPDQSLGRVEDYAKTLISNVGIVGSVLTGFALLDHKALNGAQPWIVVAILASAISLSLALISLFIEPAKVVVGDLDAVQGLFQAQLKIRTPLTMVAGGFLVVALIAATVGVAVALH